MRSSISVRVAFLTTFDLLADVKLAPGWTWGTFTIPDDFKTPETAFAMASLSSSVLNCKAVGGSDNDLGSVHPCFAEFAEAGILEPWCLNTHLGGMFM